MRCTTNDALGSFQHFGPLLLGSERLGEKSDADGTEWFRMESYGELLVQSILNEALWRGLK